MIKVVRCKLSNLPEDNYTVAICSSCKAECPGTKQPGSTKEKGWKAAYAACKSVWSLSIVERGTTRVNQLLCPKCSKAQAEGK